MRTGERAWFVVTVEGSRVEILDGPFRQQHEALRPADLHRRDGERGVRVLLRYVPRRPSWAPLYRPRYDTADV